MKSPHHFLIKLEREYDDRICDKDGNVLLWLPEGQSSRRLYGKVIAAPERLWGPPDGQPGYAEDLYPYGANFIMTDKRNHKDFVWLESTIRDEVHAGDTVFFNYNASNYNNYLGDGVLAIRPFDVVAYSKDGGKPLPYAGKIFAKKVRVEGKLYQHDSDNKAIVVGMGTPLAGTTHDFNIGDEVIYMSRFVEPFGNDLIAIPSIKILGVCHCS